MDSTRTPGSRGVNFPVVKVHPPRAIAWTSPTESALLKAVNHKSIAAIAAAAEHPAGAPAVSPRTFHTGGLCNRQ